MLSSDDLVDFDRIDFFYGSSSHHNTVQRYNKTYYPFKGDFCALCLCVAATLNINVSE